MATLGIKVFADGADLAGIAAMADDPIVRGFTTNPTLMRKAGVTDYRAFALDALLLTGDRPLCFEVFSDDFDEMEEQAREIATWGPSVYVKVPITNTRGEPSERVVRRLAEAGVKLNVTALTMVDQVRSAVSWLADAEAALVSVFAGRVADTGRDPVPLMREAVEALAHNPSVELVWASPREIFNVVQAAEIGCDIITVTNDLLAKLPFFGRDLYEYSLDTVRMFHADGLAAGYRLSGAPVVVGN